MPRVASVSNTSSIRSAVLIQHRLVVDRHTPWYIQYHAMHTPCIAVAGSQRLNILDSIMHPARTALKGCPILVFRSTPRVDLLTLEEGV